MDEIQHEGTSQGASRRTVVKTAAWAVPVVAVAASAPFAAASVEPEQASSIGGTTTSPIVGNVGRLEVFGIDPSGDDGFFPAGQTFLVSADFDFGAMVTSITGGTITQNTDNTWILTPNPGVVKVAIRFVSTEAGPYEVASRGPVDPIWNSNGNVLPA